ncbi:hypothetical protein [Cohnella silvisoli]|uniref:Uncharacterized protein n=1 Tax=Cohnella silvisoli TaxID=2873699 RepID=A0ABV1KXD4_9BACL|nr:hypothetical protein [Cohnella silvisoli]MCD9024167.1 hypothetical protein [Cohnella silvisoli]
MARQRRGLGVRVGLSTRRSVIKAFHGLLAVPRPISYTDEQLNADLRASREIMIRESSEEAILEAKRMAMQHISTVEGRNGARI